MEPQTSRKDYRNHAYSGRRRSRKRSRAQMKRYHGDESISRRELWSKKPKINDESNGASVHAAMEPQTSKKDYSNHEYSGPQKNLKRSLAQMQTYHGEEGISCRELWSKKPKINDDSNKENVNHEPSTIKTYRSKKGNMRLEASYSIEQKSTDKPSSKPKPLDINWPMIDPTVNSHELTIEYVQLDNLSGLSGNRVVDLPHVLQWAFSLERHRNKCDNSKIEFIEEVKNGFHSTFTFQCTMCRKEFRHSNENEDATNINKAFVWGAVTAGSYYTQASHITKLMDIPTMSANTFRSTEKLLGKVWQDHLTEEIKKNGIEERRLALECNNISADGIPFVDVYVDGGWPKRSYGHDYSSASGMACIIGKKTKKCLFIGVKNKYCYHCHIYEKEDKAVPEHLCFKNYEGPSTGMEAAVVVEGFQKSEEMHGVQYLKFVGDGDSSVFAQLREKVSYGQQIKKVECKNHVIKNYTGALYKILGNTKIPITGRRLLKPKLTKLTTVARKIIMTAERKCMREDLKNGPAHVFGSHINCKPYYCRFINTEENDIESLEELKTKSPTVWAQICAANESVMAKCHRLTNDTTNVVENFMSVISKFICGKRLNLHKGGSYQRRVHVAGLSHSVGPKWHMTAWKKHTKRTPGKHFSKYIAQQEKSRMRIKQYTRKRLFVPKVKPDKHYGPKAQEADEPVPVDDLKDACLSKLRDFDVTPENIKDIERQTIGQHDNELYNTHRANRLTASQFGMVCKRKAKTPCHNHVKSILYKNNIFTSDMAYGQHNESVARTLFAEKYKKDVRLAGLFIDEEFCFLGASPDGVIEEESSIIEIKCFPSLARNNQDLATAAKERKNFPVFVASNGSLQINKKHSYYYQIQGQLRVTKMSKCYFVGYISPSYDITVIEVDRDEVFIQNMMPRLATFFKNCVLPEIVLRRHQKNLKCVDAGLDLL